MLVHELMEILSAMPQRAEVVVNDSTALSDYLNVIVSVEECEDVPEDETVVVITTE